MSSSAFEYYHPFILQIPAQAGSSTEPLYATISPQLTNVVGVYLKGYKLNCSGTVPETIRITISTDAGDKPITYLGIANNSNQNGGLSGVLLFPLQALASQRQDYQIPIPLLTRIRGPINRLEIQVTSINGGALTFDGNLWLECAALYRPPEYTAAASKTSKLVASAYIDSNAGI